MAAACGVYAITHIDSGKRYIGSSINIENRIYQHKYLLNLRKHYNPYLQHAWNKHGADKFILSTVLMCSPENRVFYEQLLIDGYQTSYKNNGFNLKPIASIRGDYKESLVTRVRRIAKKFGLKPDPNNPERLLLNSKSVKLNLVIGARKQSITKQKNNKKRLKKIWCRAKSRGLI